MSDLIVFLYCLPAFLITCVMLLLASMAKHKEAEKRVFERGAIDGEASKPSAQRKKFLDKRLKITAEGVALKSAQSHRALAERGRVGVTITPRPNPKRLFRDEHTQAIIDYVQQNK